MKHMNVLQEIYAFYKGIIINLFYKPNGRIKNDL